MTIPPTFRYILKFSQLFGLASFTESDGKLVLHWPARIYSAFVLSVLFYLQGLIFQDRSGTTSLSTSFVADTLDTYGFAFTCLGSFLVHFYRFPKLLEIFNTYFALLAEYPDFDNFSKRTILAILAGIAYEVTFTVFSIFISPLDYLHLGFYVLETLTYVALELVSFIIFLQFAHLVLTCARLFRKVNKQFENLLKKIKTSRNTNSAVWLENLRFLLNEHTEIAMLCYKINHCFGIQNLLSVTLCFLELTYALYNGLINALEATPLNVLSDTLLWAGYFVYKLLATVKVCSVCVNELRIMKETLHKAFDYIEDDAFRSEIEYFSLHLIHCNIEFDAFGFFPLNFSVLHSMIGVVAGYLVILVQSQAANLADSTRNCSNVEE